MTAPVFRRPRHLLALLALALVISLIPVLRATSSARAAVTTVQSVVIDGRGNGHGGGLSQWGALGWATLYDKTWQEILAIYYPGTALAPVTDQDFRNTPIGRMRVQLSALDGLQTAVVSESGSLYSSADPTNDRWHSMVAREIPGSDNTYEIWGRRTVSCPTAGETLVPPDGDDGDSDTPPTSDDTTTTVGDTTTTVGDTGTTSTVPGTTNETSTSTTTRSPLTAATVSPLGSQWVRLATGVSGPITFLVDQVDNPAAVSPRDVIGVCQKSRSLRYYRGTVSAVNHPTTDRNYTFNSVLLEDYVRGVTPRETPASWAKEGGGKGINALRAQSVAARSYALAARPRSSGAKICDTSSCQVYGGTGLRRSVGGRYTTLENAAATRAVADTAGRVLRYGNGNVAWTIYSSSNGGRSITNVYPAINDPGDAIAGNPHHAWSRTVEAASIEKVWPQIGSLVNITVTKRTGGGVWDGWVDRLLLEGTKSTISLTGDQFRRGMKLKSRYLNFTLVRTPDKAATGPGILIGDSVALGALKELRSLVGTAYDIDFEAKQGRCLLDDEDGPCRDNSVSSVIADAETPAFAVVAVGYDRASNVTADQIDAVMEQFLARGVARVLWVNLTDRRRNTDGTLTFAPVNAALAESDAKWEQLTVLDWNAATIADSAGRWFEKGTDVSPNWATLTATGRTRFALFVRTQLDALRSQDLLPAEVSTTPITTTTTTIDPLAPTTSTTSTSTAVPSSSSPTTAPTTTATTTATPTTLKSVVALRTVRAGMRGALVRQVQRRLAALGYPVKVDGSFGRTTLRYVREFQRKNRLTDDGVVGRRTWTALGY